MSPPSLQSSQRVNFQSRHGDFPNPSLCTLWLRHHPYHSSTPNRKVNIFHGGVVKNNDSPQEMKMLPQSSQSSQRVHFHSRHGEFPNPSLWSLWLRHQPYRSSTPNREVNIFHGGVVKNNDSPQKMKMLPPSSQSSQRVHFHSRHREFPNPSLCALWLCHHPYRSSTPNREVNIFHGGVVKNNDSPQEMKMSPPSLQSSQRVNFQSRHRDFPNPSLCALWLCHQPHRSSTLNREGNIFYGGSVKNNASPQEMKMSPPSSQSSQRVCFQSRHGDFPNPSLCALWLRYQPYCSSTPNREMV